MNKEEIIARPYEEYYEMIKDMSKDNMIQGLYDLSKNCIEYQNYINQLEKTINEVREIVSKSLFKTDLVELCRMKNQIREIIDKVGGSNE